MENASKTANPPTLKIEINDHGAIPECTIIDRTEKIIKNLKNIKELNLF
jgi:hypothetical protein